jgi:hypothetical protein
MIDLLSQPPIDRAVQKAERLRRTPIQLFNTLLSSWSQGVSAIWDDADPQAVLDALGTDAAPLFQLSAQTAAFLEQLKPGCTTDAVSKIKAFTVQADGKITIDPV